MYRRIMASSGMGTDRNNEEVVCFNGVGSDACG